MIALCLLVVGGAPGSTVARCLHQINVSTSVVNGDVAAATVLEAEPACDPGYGIQNGRCKPCEPGMASPGGPNAICRRVDDDLFARAGFAAKRTPCFGKGPGFGMVRDGSATCDACKPGFGGSDCHICPKDTFSTGGSSSMLQGCSPCPGRTKTKGMRGRTHESQCMCEYRVCVGTHA